ncbi:hypothetical protein COM86_25420 [Priestia megaterium]|uniref:DUF5412 family protein n=1 Tax=Priestia TaxID=2800373 RepID=UPI000BEE423E|nr:DUF5412 family protein [Priestia megaterium]PEB61225.1 hypothetical protein COM86_25420 [Priestia megaterium]PEE75587.1 hypothetical protein COM81_17310 [Priestia megaterium]PFI89993.1 hypothetical protein COI84_23025 [Priestia megaterium]PGR05456.1 hypothetical protein COC62_28625 [Priestia megaterium]
MKKRYIVLLSALSAFLVIGFIWWFLFAPNYLQFAPKGEYISQSTSPNGDYIVKIYRPSGEATTPFAIRGEVTYTNKIFNKRKNIYWNYPQETAKVKWVNDEIVNISGHVLNVKKDTFDANDVDN